MTKEERQEGYTTNCVVHYEQVPDYLDVPAWYVHEGWMQGSEWASREQQQIDIEKACESFWEIFETQFTIKPSNDVKEYWVGRFRKAMEE